MISVIISSILLFHRKIKYSVKLQRYDLLALIHINKALYKNFALILLRKQKNLQEKKLTRAKTKFYKILPVTGRLAFIIFVWIYIIVKRQNYK